MFGHVSGEADWDIPRSTATCRHLLAAARGHGVDAATCLAGTDLTIEAINHDATEVQARQELRIIRNILALVEDSHEFATDVGLQYNFANTGILGYALLASSTIGDAVNVACRYATLSSTFLRLTRHDDDGGSVLVFDDSRVPPDVRAFLLERDMWALTKLAPLLMGAFESTVGSNPVLRIELPGLDIPAERFELDRVAIEIDTSSTRTAVTIPAEVLRQAMPAADAATAALCVKQCEDLLAARGQRRGIAARVRSRLIRDPGQLPSMAVIAAELCITERTLHRHLAAEQISYRTLIDEVRATLSSALLESGLTVEETARQLGYSETAAFTRAFVRFSGELPSRYRQRVR